MKRDAFVFVLFIMLLMSRENVAENLDVKEAEEQRCDDKRLKKINTNLLLG